MEPVSLLVTALAAGASAALKDTAGNAVKDAYAGLKGLIVRKFGKKSSIDSLEEKPGSKAKQDAAAEDLVEVQAAADPEVLAQAKAVLETVNREAPEVAEALGIDLEGIEAEFLKVGNIVSTGSGARLRDSKFSGGITFRDVTAGQKETPKDP